MLPPQYIDLYIYQQSPGEDSGCRQAARQNGVGKAERPRAQVAAVLGLLCQVMVDGRTACLSVSVYQPVRLFVFPASAPFSHLVTGEASKPIVLFKTLVLNVVDVFAFKMFGLKKKKIRFKLSGDETMVSHVHPISSRFYRSSFCFD